MLKSPVMVNSWGERKKRIEFIKKNRNKSFENVEDEEGR